MCHSAGSVLHCSFSFIFSFMHGDRTQQVAKAIRSSLGFSSYAALRHMHQRCGAFAELDQPKPWMFSIRDIDLDTNEDQEKVYSRLTWAVEKVDGLTWQLANGATVKTNRPWVGTYDKQKMEFGLTQNMRFFNLKFFPNIFLQVVVRGRIIATGDKTTVNVKLRLGWYPIFVSIALYVGAVGMIISTLVFGELADIFGLIVWILMFPVLWTFILNWKLNSVEKKVENLFGVR